MKVWCFNLAVNCVLVISLAATLPTTIPTEDSSDLEVPLEFPTLNQNYTFVDNSSIRENLAGHSDNDTEVEDLLEDVEDNPAQPIFADVNPSEEDEDIGIKSVVEFIENGDDTEDNKFGKQPTEDPNSVLNPETDDEKIGSNLENEEIGSNAKTDETGSNVEKSDEIGLSTETYETDAFPTEIYDSEPQSGGEIIFTAESTPYKDGVPLIDGSVAAIMVVVFLVICIIGYTALIVWRKSLEIKYGSRQMLVDKDEIYDPDDIRHFSI